MMNDSAFLDQEIQRIESLRLRYAEKACYVNEIDTMEAYLQWYEQARALFRRYFDMTNMEYARFCNVKNEWNGYVIQENYCSVRADYTVLIDSLKHGEMCMALPEQGQPMNEKQKHRKVFISHSSKDQSLLDEFVDKILHLGMNIPSEDIAYTSRADTGVIAGGNIPKFIHDNIECVDFVLLMLSDNYKQSEVCLNEMGAAWALKKNVIQILLPKTSFKELGWLYTLDKAIKIDDEESLDALLQQFKEYWGLDINIVTWGRNKKSFIESCVQAKSQSYNENGVHPILESSVLTNADIERLQIWVNSNTYECMRVDCEGVTIFLFGEKRYEAKHNQELADWEDFFERMCNLGYIKISEYNHQGKPIYVMTKCGYDFVEELMNSKTANDTRGV